MQFKQILRPILLVVVAALGTACIDQAAGPNAPAGAAGAVRPTLKRAKRAHLTARGDTTMAVFTVAAAGGMFDIGDHVIEFAGGAICDPGQSKYGPEYWDAPCQTASRPIQITAKAWTTEDGRPYVDFQPKLRFNPTSRVTLYLNDPAAAAHLAEAKIYFALANGTLVDEEAGDWSVSTRKSTDGYVYRRIKHFSGYVISLGFASASLESDLLLSRGASRQQSELSSSGSGRYGVQSRPVAATPLLRRKPLAQDLYASAVIGPEGGKFEIPEAGLRIDVPRRAVSAPTKFTVKAYAGDLIAYEFGPHGATFAEPLRFRQDLKPTTWYRANGRNADAPLELGYFKDRKQISDSRNSAEVDEILPVVEVKQSRVEFHVSHFSGYILATGRKSTF